MKNVPIVREKRLQALIDEYEKEDQKILEDPDKEEKEKEAKKEKEVLEDKETVLTQDSELDALLNSDDEKKVSPEKQTVVAI